MSATFLALAFTTTYGSAQEIHLSDDPLVDGSISNMEVHPIIEMAVTYTPVTSNRPELTDVVSFSTPFTDSLGRLWSFSVDFRTGLYVLEGAPGRYSSTLSQTQLQAIRFEAHRLELANWCRKNPQDWIGCAERQLMPSGGAGTAIVIGVVTIVISSLISLWAIHESNRNAEDAAEAARLACDADRLNSQAEQLRQSNECRSRSNTSVVPGGVRMCRSTPVFVEQGSLGAGSNCAPSRFYVGCEETCETVDPSGPLWP